MAGAAILVHPAEREPFGLVLLEALALGTPVIAFSSSGPKGILANGGGRLVCQGNTRELADALVAAVTEPGVLDSWRNQGLKIAEMYDIDSTVDRYLEVLEQTIA